MAFDIKNFSYISASANSDSPRLFSYASSTDTRDTITASAYFNEVHAKLKISDIIFVEGSNGRAAYYVTGVTPNVTVLFYDKASNLSLDEGEIIIGSATNQGVPLDVSTDGGVLVGNGTTAVSGRISGASAADVADDSTTSGLALIHTVAVTGGATADYNITLDHKFKVAEVWFVNHAAGDTSDTIQVKNTAAVITDAMDANLSANVVQRASELVQSAATIPAGGILRVTQTDGAGSNAAAATVYVLGFRVA